AERVRADLAAVLAEPMLTARGPVEIVASFGASAYPADGSDFDALLQAADARMYRAKRLRR
ncbi:MAG: hypothetical protein QOC98_2791, partial [Frankiaceae bacterium]|nr:hypothetical protein [Frankiaceae bacterium]